MTVQTMLDQLATHVATAEVEVEIKDIYRIGDLAREFDVSLRTLRFYEDRGLISPQRSGNTRLYSNEDRQRLSIILLAKNVGFSLIDIQYILKAYDGDGDNKDISKLTQKFHEQYENLARQRAELDDSINDLSNAISWIEARD